MSSVEIGLIILGVINVGFGIAIIVVSNNNKKEIIEKTIKESSLVGLLNGLNDLVPTLNSLKKYIQENIPFLLGEINKIIPSINAIKKYLENELPEIVDAAIEEDNKTDVSLLSREYQGKIKDINASLADSEAVNLLTNFYISQELAIEQTGEYFIEDFEFLLLESSGDYSPVIFNYDLSEKNRVLSIYFNENTLDNLGEETIKIKLTYLRE